MPETMPVTEEQAVVYFPIDTHEPDLDRLEWAIRRQKHAAQVAVRFGCTMQTEWVDGQYRDLVVGVPIDCLEAFLEALDREFHPASVNYRESDRFTVERGNEIAEQLNLQCDMIAV